MAPVPSPNPGQVVVITQNPGELPSGRLRLRANRKPKPREKEKKVWIGQLAARVLGPILSNLTESMDFAAAFYKALPKCVRPKGYVSPLKMAQTVYDNFEYLDLRAVMGNILAMQAEDYVIGRASREVQEFSAGGHLHTSLDTGLRRIFENLGIEGTPDIGIIGDTIRGRVDALMSDYEPPKAPC